MLLGYRIKKRSMRAYDKVIVPELKGYGLISEEQAPPPSAAKRHIKSALRAAACIALAFTLIGVIVSRNAQGPGATNSFTLVAYAASSSGDAADENGYTISLKSIDLSTGAPLKPNTEIPLPVSKNYQVNHSSEVGKFDIDYSSFSYLSGFQFSGSTIDSITMTTEKGKFVAYDSSKTGPIYQKYAKVYPQGNNIVVSVTSSDQFTDEEMEVIQTYSRVGKTVTFPLAGFISYWNYTPDEDGNVSDTITITIKFIDGSTQNSVVSINENENGVITAELQ